MKRLPVSGVPPNWRWTVNLAMPGIPAHPLPTELPQEVLEAYWDGPSAQHAHQVYQHSVAIAQQMTRPTESKPRLSKEEVDLLEAEFQKNHKPGTAVKKELAERIGVTVNRINNWFQNRRAREKKERNVREYEAKRRLEKEQAESSRASQDTDSNGQSVASIAPFPAPSKRVKLGSGESSTDESTYATSAGDSQTTSPSHENASQEFGDDSSQTEINDVGEPDEDGHDDDGSNYHYSLSALGLGPGFVQHRQTVSPASADHRLPPSPDLALASHRIGPASALLTRTPSHGSVTGIDHGTSGSTPQTQHYGVLDPRFHAYLNGQPASPNCVTPSVIPPFSLPTPISPVSQHAITGGFQAAVNLSPSLAQGSRTYSPRVAPNLASATAFPHSSGNQGLAHFTLDENFELGMPHAPHYADSVHTGRFEASTYQHFTRLGNPEYTFSPDADLRAACGLGSFSTETFFPGYDFPPECATDQM